MTRNEIDTMWQQALCAAVADGEMFTRYRFSELLEAKVRADERKACAKRVKAEHVGESLTDGNLCDVDFAYNKALQHVAAILERGEK